MKGKFKKIILIMLFVVSYFVMLSVSVGAESEEFITDGDYTYIVENEEARITGFEESVTGPITIPSILGGYPVTAIGMWAFNSCTGLTSVTIPDSVTTIDIEAFYWCTNLTSVTIPNSVLYIENGAFRSCFSLESIIIPDSVITVGKNAFNSCSGLTSVVIGSGTTTIGNAAFYGCEKLTCIEIPDNVISIENNAFFNCLGLMTVTIGSGVTDIGGNVFHGCGALTSIYVNQANESYCSVDGILFNKDMTYLMAYPRKKADTDYKIPDGVTTVSASAFYDCSSLTSITIPNSVTTIEAMAFYNCYNLKDVYYIGTQEEWDNISIASSNSYLTNATIYCIKPYTLTNVVEGEGCKIYQVEYYWVPSGSEVMIACYNNDVLAHLETKNDNCESFTVSNEIIYNKVKIFVWESFMNMKSITDVEEVE